MSLGFPPLRTPALHMKRSRYRRWQALYLGCRAQAKSSLLYYMRLTTKRRGCHQTRYRSWHLPLDFTISGKTTGACGRTAIKIWGRTNPGRVVDFLICGTGRIKHCTSSPPHPRVQKRSREVDSIVEKVLVIGWSVRKLRWGSIEVDYELRYEIVTGIKAREERY